MTDAQIKEELSIHIFSALAARSGYSAIKPRIDHGHDLVLYPALKLPYRKQMVSGGNWIAVQLKTTTESQVVEKDNYILFDLKSKNYDDLVFRNSLWLKKKSVVPLVLVLLVLLDSADKWLAVDFEKKTYSLNGMFYWYSPSNGVPFTQNSSKKRISIPIENKIDLDFFNKTFNLYFKSKIQ